MGGAAPHHPGPRPLADGWPTSPPFSRPAPLQVVVSTCNGSGEARLEGQKFRIVVLDEASQVGWGGVGGGWLAGWGAPSSGRGVAARGAARVLCMPTTPHLDTLTRDLQS